MTWLLVFSYSNVLTIRTPRYSFPSCIELSLTCSKFGHSLTCGNREAMLTTKSSFCEIWRLLSFFTLDFALVVIPYIAAYNIHNFMLPYISQLFSHGNSLTFWNRWKKSGRFDNSFILWHCWAEQKKLWIFFVTATRRKWYIKMPLRLSVPVRKSLI